MKKNNKGFTLIELLAIIVILAIIAVITVPIILNVIENAKKGAAIDSAYGYKDAISKYYVSKIIDNPDFKLVDGAYKVTKDGFLTKEGKQYEIETSGTSPSGGWVSMENNTSTSGCLTIGDYKVQINDDDVTAEKGKCKFGGGVVKDEDLENLDHEYTGLEAIVYLDPTDLTTKCDANIAASNVKDGVSGSPTGVNTGCMKWYAYEDKNGYYTMILDHNTSESNVEWNSDIDENDSYTNTKGPSKNSGQLLATLKENTKNWVVAEPVTVEDNYRAILDNKEQLYIINYSGYRARLISAEEINRITEFFNPVNASEIKYGQFCSSRSCQYGWLLDNTGSFSESPYAPNCIQYGCSTGKSSDPYGFWTASPKIDDPDDAWVVDYVGYLSSVIVNDSKFRGVRPVIKVSKSLLLSE